MIMELLEYLIRTLTYKRSCWELDLKKLLEQDKYEFSHIIRIQAKIDGIQFAITEIYKLVEQTEDGTKSTEVPK